MGIFELFSSGHHGRLHLGIKGGFAIKLAVVNLVLELGDLVQELSGGHDLFLDDHVGALALDLINVDHADGHGDIIDYSVDVVLNLLDFVDFHEGLLRNFVQHLLLVGGLKPVLLDVLDHPTDIVDLIGDSGVDRLAFFHELLESLVVGLFIFHLLDQGSYRLQILFYLLKKALDVVFDHLEDLWLDDALKNSLVHGVEVI